MSKFQIPIAWNHLNYDVGRLSEPLNRFNIRIIVFRNFIVFYLFMYTYCTSFDEFFKKKKKKIL